MPLNKYYKGDGNKVMKSMTKTYGKNAKKVFYATANKLDLNPSNKTKKKILDKK